MSGERAQPPPGWPPSSRYGERTVAITNDRRGVVQRSVASLADLPADLPRAALVGGLAVMVRLYQAHRVTTDFDEVTEHREETIAVLLARGAVRTSNGVLLPDHGVQLDLLDAGLSLPELATLIAERSSDPADPVTEAEQRAIQLALVCRYALETAVDTKIFVVDHDEVVASVTIPVALAGALVAMKVHAAVQPERQRDKAAGDIYDSYRLIRAWGPSVIAEDLSRAPVPMIDACARQIEQVFAAGADRSARMLRSASMPGVQTVGVEDLEAAGSVVGALEPFRHWDPAVTGTVTEPTGERAEGSSDG